MKIYQKMYQPIYDKLQVEKGILALHFFQTPLGGDAKKGVINTNQPTAWTTSSGSKKIGKRKSQSETNMDQGGSLPYPKSFFITGVTLVPTLCSGEHNVKQYLENSWARLFMDAKDYLVLPAQFLYKDPKFFSWDDPAFSFDQGTTLPEIIKEVPFRVEVNTPDGAPAGGFGLYCMLHGYFQKLDKP